MSDRDEPGAANDFIEVVQSEILGIACLIEAEAEACLWPEDQDRLRALAARIRARVDELKA